MGDSKMRYFITSIMISCMVFSSVAFAHTVDREDQKRVKHLGLDDPEFFELWFDYWHERRELVGDMGEYNQCVGAIKQIYRIARWGEFTGENRDIIDYWDVIPAVPLEEKPGDKDNAKEHIKAGEKTRELFNYHAYNCYLYRDYLEWYLGLQ